jgi:hypothetical protein
LSEHSDYVPSEYPYFYYTTFGVLVTFTDAFSGRKGIGVTLELCSRNHLRGLAQENGVAILFLSFVNFRKITSNLYGCARSACIKQRIFPAFFIL